MKLETNLFGESLENEYYLDFASHLLETTPNSQTILYRLSG